MSTATVPEEAPPTLDEFSTEWLSDLRSMLGKKRKRMSIRGVKIGIKRKDKSSAVDKFTALYRETNNRLKELRLKGVNVTAHEIKYNELVQESREVAAEPVDKSGSTDTREKKIKATTTRFVELNNRLKEIEKLHKKASKQIPWSRNQELCGNKLKEFVRTWATDADARGMRNIFDTLVADGNKLEAGDRQTQGEEYKGKFTNLHRLLSDKIDSAKSAKKQYEKEVKQTKTRLQAMREFWDGEAVQREVESVRTALDALSRRDYLAARDEIVTASNRLLQLIKAGKTAKERYESLMKVATTALQRYQDAGVPKTKQLDAAEDLRKATQLAGNHNYLDAASAVETFIANCNTSRQSFLTAKGKWEADWKAELGRKRIESVTSLFPESFYRATLKELDKRVARMEYLVNQTGDLETAVDKLKDIQEWFDSQIESWQISETDSESTAIEKRNEFLELYRETKVKIGKADEELGLTATLLYEELEAAGVDESQIATESDLLDAYRNATEKLEALKVKAQGVIDNGEDRETHKGRENALIRLQELKESHATQLQNCRDLFSSVLDQSTPPTDLKQQIEDQADISSAEADAINESVEALETLQTQMETLLEDVTKEGGLLEVARRNLKEKYDEFHEAYKSTRKRFGGDQSKVYDALHTSGEQIVGFVVKSTSVPAIEEAQRQLEEVMQRLEEVSRDGDEFNAVNSNIETWKTQRQKVKNHKDFKRFFREEYDALLEEYDEVHSAILSATSSERAGRWLNTLARKSAIAFSDAEKTRAAYDGMKEDLSTVSFCLEQFTEVGVFDTDFHDRYKSLRDIQKKRNPFALISNQPKAAKLRESVAKYYRNLYEGGARRLWRNQSSRARKQRSEEEENTRRLQEWLGQLNLLRNHEWKEAKEAVEGDPSGDSKAIQIIRKQIHEAEKMARKFQFDAAFNRLEIIRAQCLKLKRSPSGGNTSGSLEKLKRAWPTTVKSLSDAVSDLQSAIRSAAEQTELDTYTSLLNDQLPQPVVSFEPQVFEPIIGTMCDSRSSSRARLRAREEGIAYVQTFLRRLQDPLLQAMIKNQFKVSVPAGNLYRKLSDLEYHLKTSN